MRYFEVISHRGNLDGPSEHENYPDYIEKAHRKLIELGYGVCPGQVEVDLWKIDDKLYLGHDAPTYEYDIEKDRYRSLKIYHLKNKEAILGMLDIGEMADHYFAHVADPYVITSLGKL